MHEQEYVFPLKGYGKVQALLSFQVYKMQSYINFHTFQISHPLKNNDSLSSLLRLSYSLLSFWFSLSNSRLNSNSFSIALAMSLILTSQYLYRLLLIGKVQDLIFLQVHNETMKMVIVQYVSDGIYR